MSAVTRLRQPVVKGQIPKINLPLEADKRYFSRDCSWRCKWHFLLRLWAESSWCCILNRLMQIVSSTACTALTKSGQFRLLNSSDAFLIFPSSCPILVLHQYNTNQFMDYLYVVMLIRGDLISGKKTVIGLYWPASKITDVSTPIQVVHSTHQLQHYYWLYWGYF